MERNVKQPENGLDIFKLYWAGKGKLSVAYWGYGFAGTFAIYVFAMIGALLLLPTPTEESDSLFDSRPFAIYVALVLVVLTIYQFVVWILIWRNASNTSHPIWALLAKVAVASGVILFLYRLIQLV